MTKSMYYRSLASQHQSKAGDQWAFFQAKRIRGTSLDMTAELLQSLGHADPFVPAQLPAETEKVLHALEDAAKDSGPQQKTYTAAAAVFKAAQEQLTILVGKASARQSFSHLAGSDLPKIDVQALSKPGVREILNAIVKAISERQPESATANLVRSLSLDDIEEATGIAEKAADQFDKACEPLNETVKQLRQILGKMATALQPLRGTGSNPAANSSAAAMFDRIHLGFKVAAFDLDARRYRQEAFYNRQAAELDEVRVRRTGLDSDRHRERSKKFFYSMLMAQLGVTVASLALARAERSLLWLLAALAGVLSLAFTGYVYMSP
jgi:hypothetical protein